MRNMWYDFQKAKCGFAGITWTESKKIELQSGRGNISRNQEDWTSESQEGQQAAITGHSNKRRRIRAWNLKIYHFLNLHGKCLYFYVCSRRNFYIQVS